MGLVPKLKTSCMCCTMKTGSFVTACFLLVGSSVQTGYYAFLVDHMYPQKMCTAVETILVKEERSSYPSYDYDMYNDPLGGGYNDFYFPLWGYNWHPPPPKSGPPKGKDAANTTASKPANAGHKANTTDGKPADGVHAANTTASKPANVGQKANTTDGKPADAVHAANTAVSKPASASSTANTAHRKPESASLIAKTTDNKLANSHDAAQHAANTTSSERANSTDATPTNSTNASQNSNDTNKVSGKRTPQQRRRYNYPRRRWGWGFWGPRRPQSYFATRSYLRPCERDYKPFDADNGFLDFDLRAPFDKTILYFNIAIWATMMVCTTLLMAGVYKESAAMVTAWLVAEALLLMVATASTMATAASMIRTVPVQIPIVTLLNMAIHLAIDIYFMIVVINFRQELTTKKEDDDDEGGGDDTEAVQVTV